ncbi:MAG: GIY-YIG nuclease family protein [Chlamydiota bacterium]|nr:GIY-YIG nuclease family protein [Chlamydiota bacterium]
MHYVYILQSTIKPNARYIGFSTNLKDRLSYHNSGSSPHTSKYKPWILLNYFAFSNKNKAYKFEKYLKSASGRAFSKKHFL